MGERVFTQIFLAPEARPVCSKRLNKTKKLPLPSQGQAVRSDLSRRIGGLDSTAIAEAEVKAYYEQKDEEIAGDFHPYDRLSAQDKNRIKKKMMQDFIASYVDSVSAYHEITINDTVLDTLPLAVSTVNPYMTVHLLKSNSNKMPFPIVDPNWKPVTGQ